MTHSSPLAELPGSESDGVSSWYAWVLVGLFVPTHLLLLIANALANSATADEPAHLASGVVMWKLHRFDIYMVNPPLVRLVAAIPVTVDDPPLKWPHLSEDPGLRPEWSIGRDFARASGRRFLWFVAQGRFACLLFSVIGLLTCSLWVRSRLGNEAATAAAALWTFSPMILAHGSLFTSDVASASMGMLAIAAFNCWLQEPRVSRSCLAGIALGLAEATKMTWVVLFPLYILVWLTKCAIARVPSRRHKGAAHAVHGSGWRSEVVQLALIICTGLTVLAATYGFTDVFKPLGEFEFYSHALGGEARELSRQASGESFTQSGNRFRDSIVGHFPVLVPAAFLQGIDIQRRDFEGGWRNYDSYAAGNKAKHGWLWFYPYCLAVKCPLALLGLMLLAIPSSWRWLKSAMQNPEEVVIAAIPLVVLWLIVSETSFSRCFRYLLPLWPFLIILLSTVFSKYGRPAIQKVGGILLCAYAITSIAATPQHLSFFNFIAGGPMEGHHSLLDSNLDWGQDLFRLKAWRSQPEHSTERLYLAVSGTLDPDVLGIDYEWPKASPPGSMPDLSPGWYVVSANLLHGFDADAESWEYFQDLTPVDRVGHTMFVYHVGESKGE